MMLMKIQQQKSVAMMQAMRRCILAARSLARLFRALWTLANGLQEYLAVKM